MIDVINPRCQMCKLYLVSNSKKYCSDCDPDCAAFKKKKELKVLKLLEDNISEDIVHNKKISSPYKIFPDFRIYPENKTHVVIVEVDEYQHKNNSYNLVCENERMRLITEAENLPCVFIRYNPDSFNINGKRKFIPEKERLDLLLKNVKRFINKKKFVKNMYVFKLFFDRSCEDDMEIIDKCFQTYDLEKYFKNLQKVIQNIKEENIVED